MIDPDIARLVGDGPDPNVRFVSTDELADMIGVNARRIEELVRAKIIPRVSRGRFDARAAVRAYCADIRLKSQGRGTANPELVAEKTRLAREQADKIANQNAASRGEMLPAATVEAEWASILRDVRAGMLALPSRVQQRLGHLTTHDVAAIDREIRTVLEETARG